MKNWKKIVLIASLLVLPVLGNFGVKTLGHELVSVALVVLFLALFFQHWYEEKKTLLTIGFLLAYLLESVGVASGYWAYPTQSIPYYVLFGWPCLIMLAHEASDWKPESFVFKNLFLASLVVYFLILQFLQPDLMRYFFSLAVIIPLAYQEENSVFIALMFALGEITDFAGIFFNNWYYPVKLAFTTWPLGAGTAYALFGWAAAKLSKLVGRLEERD